MGSRGWKKSSLTRTSCLSTFVPQQRLRKECGCKLFTSVGVASGSSTKEEGKLRRKASEGRLVIGLLMWVTGALSAGHSLVIPADGASGSPQWRTGRLHLHPLALIRLCLSNPSVWRSKLRCAAGGSGCPEYRAEHQWCWLWLTSGPVMVEVGSVLAHKPHMLTCQGA